MEVVIFGKSNLVMQRDKNQLLQKSQKEETLKYRISNYFNEVGSRCWIHSCLGSRFIEGY